MSTKTVHERSTSEAAVRAAIEGHRRAVSQKNAAEAISFFADDFVRFDLDPPLVHAGAQDRHGDELEAWFRTWKGPIGVESRDLVVETGDDVAFARSLTRIRGTKTDGEEVDMWIRSTLGLRRIDGDWKIVHEHASVPFYMDGSFKAAIDLQP